MSKTLKDLTVQEVLALAIQAEEEDGRIYGDLAKRIGGDFPETAKALQSMHDEEDDHRHRLIEIYQTRFGEHIPLLRRQDVKGFISRNPCGFMPFRRLPWSARRWKRWRRSPAPSIRPPPPKPVMLASVSCSGTWRPRKLSKWTKVF